MKTTLHQNRSYESKRGAMIQWAAGFVCRELTRTGLPMIEVGHPAIDAAVRELWNRDPNREPNLSRVARVVRADSVEDYLVRYYRPERYRGRPSLTATYQDQLDRQGWITTSHFDNITGYSIYWPCYPKDQFYSHFDVDGNLVHPVLSRTEEWLQSLEYLLQLALKA